MNAYHKLSVKKIDELIDKLHEIKYYKTRMGFHIPQKGFKSTVKMNKEPRLSIYKISNGTNDNMTKG